VTQEKFNPQTSPVATGAFGDLVPPNKLQAPQIET